MFCFRCNVGALLFTRGRLNDGLGVVAAAAAAVAGGWDRGVTLRSGRTRKHKYNEEKQVSRAF